MQDPCVVCEKGCRRNQRAIPCDECDKWFHANCISMNKAEFEDLCKPSSAWQCMTCLFADLNISTQVSCGITTEFEGKENE